MDEKEVVSCRQSGERKEQLREIMSDAVKHVLERPESRRGPYVINDSDLKRVSAR